MLDEIGELVDFTGFDEKTMIEFEESDESDDDASLCTDGDSTSVVSSSLPSSDTEL